MTKQILSLTNAAVERVKQLLAMRDRESAGIKVVVEKGGCSGLQYKIQYADEIGKFDEIVEQDGVKVIIDPKAILYLIGSVMDYTEEQFKSGFVFSNPNEKGNCGCGKSFHV